MKFSNHHVFSCWQPPAAITPENPWPRPIRRRRPLRPTRKNRRPRSPTRSKIRRRRLVMRPRRAVNRNGRRAATRSTQKSLIRRSHQPRSRVKRNPPTRLRKKALGDAYFKRAEALTDARTIRVCSRRLSACDQIRSDQTLEAKNWIEKIIMIYESA